MASSPLTSDDRPPSGSRMNDQQLGQHQPTFSPPSKLPYSPKRPSPLRQCYIAPAPEFPKLSHHTRFSSLDNNVTRTPSLRSYSSADYLRELRNNRAARLNGSRPAPPSRVASKRQRPSASEREAFEYADELDTGREEPAQTTTIDYRAHSRSKSMEPEGRSKFAGRPLIPAPIKKKILPVVPNEEQADNTTQSTSRPDSERRKPEPQETHSLRKAMEDVHLDTDEEIHAAAQDEAAELVYNHRTGTTKPSAYKNPDTDPAPPKKDYRAHLRTRSALPWNNPHSSEALPKITSSASAATPSSTSPATPLEPTNTPSTFTTGLKSQDDPFIEVTPPASSKGKSYEKLAGAVAGDVAQSRRRTSSGNGPRKSSGGNKRSHPSEEVKIFEEPDEYMKEARVAEAERAAEKALADKARKELAERMEAENTMAERLRAEKAQAEKMQAERAQAERMQAEKMQAEKALAEKAQSHKPDERPQETEPRHVRRNPFARVRQAQEKIERKETPSGYSVERPTDAGNRVRPSASPANRFNRVEIFRNPPSQSRKAGYVTNDTPPPTPPQAVENKEVEGSPLLKDGVEIRGDDIRAATSMRRKDRSTNLPQPTAVTDSPGRPIVSFQQDWNTIELKEEKTAAVPKSSRSGRDSSSREPPRERALPQLPSSLHQSPYRPRVQQTASAPVSVPVLTISDSSSSSMDIPTIQTPVADLPGGIPIIVTPDDFESPSRTLPEEPDLPRPLLQTEKKSPPDLPRPLLQTEKKSPPDLPRPLLQKEKELPPLPTISEPPNLSDRSLPKRKPVARPLPIPSTRTTPSTSTSHARRPLPTTSNTTPFPQASQPHYTPSVRRNTALCAHCALPISGRILSAAGERFHPGCFKCHQCSINLECVAFYPEPEQKRHERLTRIHHRQQGRETRIPEGFSEQDLARLEELDGDEGLRFFCHLDFHEMFSPRCKSCKTPIEGEVVVACGAEWHVGHFFCAQCGDPFDSSTPFVEKEGYAWCVGCHTNRYSAKCKRCKKPVTDVVLKALGAEWHSQCFTCTECNGLFEDGRYFLRGSDQNPVCVRCEDRRLKSY